MPSISSLRVTAWPTSAHEKAEALSGPPKDRTTIGGLKIRKKTATPANTPAATPQRTIDPRVMGALNGMVECGLKLTSDVDESIEKSFKEKREALIRIGAPYTMVASFANLEEMELYTRLRKGVTTSQTFQELQNLDSKGLSFYFSRDTGPLLGKLPLEGPKAWLRTDAAGAAILLARGESLRLLGADGSDQKLASSEDIGSVKTEGSEQKKDVRDLLDYLEGLGTRVEADYPLPEDMLASDYEKQYWTQQKNLLTSGFVERPQSSDFLARGKMLKDLAEGEEINLTLPGQTRPVPVNREQAQLVKKFLHDAHPDEFDFVAAYDQLTRSGGKVFVRQMHGDAKGQLVESKTNLATYLNLASGGECVVLDRQGDLKPFTDLHSFSMSCLGQDKNPAAAAFMADYNAMKAAGYVFFKPEGPDPHTGQESWSTPGPALILRELSATRPILVQKSDGSQGQLLSNHNQMSAFMQAAGVEGGAPVALVEPRPAVDPAVPKKNLVMVYYSALHNSMGPLGVYDDFAFKLRQIGSSDDRDLITLRSDKTVKGNLRLDYCQPGRFENIRQLDPATMLSEPEVLENFIYESVKRHPADEKLRLIVLGHGSAEFGIMDDFAARPDGSLSVDRIEVDDFAGAIKKALDRVESETGKRPVIDNLILNSCLMGNASMVQALAETGDVKALSASPELMLDSFPGEAITELKGDVDGKDFARRLVDVYKNAGAFPGGRSNRVNSLVFGSYDCDPQKARQFKSSLKEFFAACTARQDLAAYLAEDIADCPGYNIHRTGGPGPGFDNRDLIQVARKILKDARIDDERIKAACGALVEASKAQVLGQHAADAYKDREGPSCFLPVSKSSYDPNTTPVPTALLRDTGFKPFIEMIQAAPRRTQAHENALTRLYTEQGDAMVQMVLGLQGFRPDGQAILEQQFVTKLEKPVNVSRVRQGANTALRAAFGAVGGALGLALGAVVGLPTGVFKGALGGFTGHSMQDGPGSPPTRPSRPAPPAPEPDPVSGPVTPASSAGLASGTLLQVQAEHRSIAENALLAAAEGVGTMTNKTVSYRYGSLAGKAAGVPAGIVGGAVVSTLVHGAGGAVVGWQLGQKLADWLLPVAPKRPE